MIYPRINWDEVEVGTDFTAEIRGAETFGKIQKLSNDRIYLCQDDIQGSDCISKLGFKYSWAISAGTPSALDHNRVTNLKLIKRDPMDLTNYFKKIKFV